MWWEQFYCKFPADCDTGRILKISQYLMNLCLNTIGLFFLDTVSFLYSCSLSENFNFSFYIVPKNNLYFYIVLAQI